MNQTNALESLVERCGELYTLPAIACEVLELTADPTTGARQLTACIERDPALTAKILRVVNSSLFGLSQTVGNLSQAVALLGAKPLKLLVLGFSLPNDLLTGTTAEVLADYWKHTLTKAVAARQLAELFDAGESDEAFLAALLSDLGMLALIQAVGEPYVQIVHRVRAAQRDLAAVEHHALGFDHQQLTVRMLRQWRMPEILATSISAARLPTTDESTADDNSFDPSDDAPALNPALGPRVAMLARILRLAERFALLLAERQTDVLAEILVEVRRDFDLNDMKLATLTNALEQQVAQLAEVLNVKLPARLEYRTVLTMAHEQLAAAACDAAGSLARHERPRKSRDGLAQQLLDEVERLTSLVSTTQVAAGSRTTVRRQLRDVSPVPDQEALSTSAPRAGSAASPTTRELGSGPAAATKSPAPAEKPRAAERLAAPVTSAIMACRQLRCAMSLMLVGVDRWDAILQRLGEPAAAAWHRQLLLLAGRCDLPGASCLDLGQGNAALLLPGSEREPTLEFGQELLAMVRARNIDDASPRFSISIGVASVALPPRNFAAEQLLEAARRCLFAAQRSGNALKSVEVY